MKIDNNYYSVPYDYIKCTVDVRVARNIVEVFYKNIRIASHKRSNKTGGDFCTFPDHMPRDHRKYASFDKEFILEWGATTGPSTKLTIERILESYPTEKQGLKSTYALMKLADKYSVERIEKACERVLSYTPRPEFKSIQTILKTGHDKLPLEKTSNQRNTPKMITHTGSLVALLTTEGKIMTTDNTLTKLNEMRMSAMAETFREQMRNPEYQELSFVDRFGLLVDIEWSRRQNNKLDRLIKQAELRDT